MFGLFGPKWHTCTVCQGNGKVLTEREVPGSGMFFSPAHVVQYVTTCLCCYGRGQVWK